ncbi:MAG TPA: TolC family protein, partial [Bryobacteraceae bacterium]|nr:TolC family protein [Bryobacteraceae bacterium]
MTSGLRFVIAAGIWSAALFAQSGSIDPVRPRDPVLWRAWSAPTVPPVRLTNSDRLRQLVRAGHLDLTARDAIALALENNIDIEVARYTQPLLEWNLERAQAGGALPGVPSNASQSSSVASGQGVLGSQVSAGVSIGGLSLGAGGIGNATIAQIGPVAQTLDPIFQEATTFSHRTVPEPDVKQSIIPVLIQGQKIYSGSLQQGLLSGGSVTVNYNDHYLNENAPTDLLNPSSAATASVTISHNLAQGFGRAVNGRTISVARVNLGMSDLMFRTQVENVVVSVLDAYYALSADYDDLRSKQEALETARRFLNETRRRFEEGTLAALDVTAAENQLAIADQALVNSRTALELQQVQLRNLLSRTGSSDAAIAHAEILPLDHLAVPDSGNLPPVDDLIRKASGGRSDLLTEQGNLRAAAISALGTRNGLLPTLSVSAGTSDAGLAGVPRTYNGQTTSSYLAGGIGNALAQIFRRNFPTENISVTARVTLRNGRAQADFGVDQLQLRQQELVTARDGNQVQVDVVNAVVAVQQARARYESARQSRILQARLLDAEQQKFDVGTSTSYNVVQEQRDLTAAQSAELSALVGYELARINLDWVTGATLESNGVSLEDARNGKS